MLSSWALHNCTAAQQSGGGRVLAMAKADRLAADRIQKKSHRAEGSIEQRTAQLQSLRFYQVLRDTVCQRPLKCLLERTNTLKYSFSLFPPSPICFNCFQACIKLIYSLHIRVFCYFTFMIAIIADLTCYLTLYMHTHEAYAVPVCLVLCIP